MQIALRDLESQLRTSSRLYARLKRDSNPNAIFHDLRDFKTHGVEILLRRVPAQVVEIRPDDQSIVLDRAVQFQPDVPIFCHGQPCRLFTLSTIVFGLRMFPMLP